jgi:hypothetical protein
MTREGLDLLGLASGFMPGAQQLEVDLTDRIEMRFEPPVIGEQSSDESFLFGLNRELASFSASIADRENPDSVAFTLAANAATAAMPDGSFEQRAAQDLCRVRKIASKFLPSLDCDGAFHSAK